MSGVGKGLTAMGAPVVKTGIAVAGVSASFTPVAWALGPWIGAYQVGSTYSTVSRLYDLLPEHSVGPETHPCRCGRCSATIGYVIDKFEWHAAETGIAVATLGVSEMIRKPGKYLYRKFTGTEKKLPMCETLRSSADPSPTGTGCKKAQAAIFVLMKDPKKAVATIAASDGGSHLKSAF